MDSIYYFFGFGFTWLLILCIVCYLYIKARDYNEKHYTWLYQVLEITKVYFRYRNKSFEDRDTLEGARDFVHNKKGMIFKKWHLNFIEKKIKQHDNTIRV